MPRIAQRHAGGHVARIATFDGHGSLRATRHYSGHYVVYSYSTPILAIDEARRLVIVNRAKYSVTTSKQQTYTFSGVASLQRDGYSVVNVESARELEDALGQDVATWAR